MKFFESFVEWYAEQIELLRGFMEPHIPEDVLVDMSHRRDAHAIDMVEKMSQRPGFLARPFFVVFGL